MKLFLKSWPVCPASRRRSGYSITIWAMVAACCMACLLGTSTPSLAQSTFRVDGNEGDWANREPIITRTSTGLELWAGEVLAVYGAVSQNSLYVMIKTAQPARELGNVRYEFWVDLDGDCRREYLFSWQHDLAWVRDMRWRWGKAYQFPGDQTPVEHDQAREEVAEFRIPLQAIGGEPDMRLLVHTYIEGIGSTYTSWGTIGQSTLSQACITLDGHAADWQTIPILAEDPPHETGMPASDLRQVKAFTTQDALYLMFQAANVIGRSPNAVYCFYADVNGDGLRDYNVGIRLEGDVGHYGWIWDLRKHGEPNAYAHPSNRRDLTVFTAAGDAIVELVLPLRMLEGASETLDLAFFTLRGDQSPANPPTAWKQVGPLSAATTPPTPTARITPTRTAVASPTPSATPTRVRATATAASSGLPTLPPTRTPTPTQLPYRLPTLTPPPTLYERLFTPQAWFIGIAVGGISLVLLALLGTRKGQ